MEDILIDTNIVIEYLRAENKSETLLARLSEKNNVFLTSITELELFLGARTEHHKKDLEMIFDEVEVLSFEFGCGEIAANIWNELNFKVIYVESIPNSLVCWRDKMKTYVFKVELEEEDGVWTAVVPSLSGCNAWANTKEEVLAAIQENTKAYLETLIEDGQPVPIEEKEIKVPLQVPAIAVII